MNSFDEWSEVQLRFHEVQVGKVVKISQNDAQWLNFALWRALFTTKYHSQCINKV